MPKAATEQITTFVRNCTCLPFLEKGEIPSYTVYTPALFLRKKKTNRKNGKIPSYPVYIFSACVMILGRNGSTSKSADCLKEELFVRKPVFLHTGLHALEIAFGPVRRETRFCLV